MLSSGQKRALVVGGGLATILAILFWPKTARAAPAKLPVPPAPPPKQAEADDLEKLAQPTKLEETDSGSSVRA